VTSLSFSNLPRIILQVLDLSFENLFSLFFSIFLFSLPFRFFSLWNCLVWKRDGLNLHYTAHIGLIEAMSLAENYYSLVHLDGRAISLELDPNGVIQPGEVRVIHGEGMPNKSMTTSLLSVLVSFSFFFYSY